MGESKTRLAPLAGTTALDLSKVLAGPVCAQILADMGADVIKIETIEGGDDTRRWPPFRKAGDNQDGTVFLSANRGKRSIAIDLKTETGRAVMRQLASTADIVVESYGPGVAKRLGVDAETLREINPRLVHCSITGFGTEGPMRSGKGYDVILQAFSGMLGIIGNPGDPPIRVPFSPIDQATGYHAVIGIMGALFERGRSGTGASVEVSLFDSAVGFMGFLLQSFWERGTEPQRHGSGHESLCPYEAFETADKPIMLGVANDVLWRAFCGLAGTPELAHDPKFATNADRVANRAETVALTREILKRRSRDDWINDLNKVGIPCSPIHTLGELSSHPHLTESGMRVNYGHPAYGSLSGIAQAVKFNGTRAMAELPPPLFGEHTKDILLSLGYSYTQIFAMHEAGEVFARS